MRGLRSVQPTASRSGAPLVLTVLVLVTLSGCGGEPIAGTWIGSATFKDDDPVPEAQVELLLEQEGHKFTGSLFFHVAEAFGTSMPSREFTVSEGVWAEDQIYFFATAQLPTGTATVRFYGKAVEEELDGDLSLDISTTEGRAAFQGHLEAVRQQPR